MPHSLKLIRHHKKQHSLLTSVEFECLFRTPTTRDALPFSALSLSTQDQQALPCLTTPTVHPFSAPYTMNAYSTPTAKNVFFFPFLLLKVLSSLCRITYVHTFQNHELNIIIYEEYLYFLVF